MMQLLLWGVFIFSLSFLLFVLIKNRSSIQWLARLGIHIVIAGVLLYAVNWIGGYYGFRLPINPATIAAVTFLGIPGIGMLAAIKLVLL
ncbi:MULTISPECIES: pro-sigmaK processing inhibitor BofA family protein [Paenibacillus]|uniref:Pro-sigmaK processing inhibitor BofA family protein n=1 Tax=Paenibacillus residui TaxID=629724 RepID=A0ABW3D630_9BACL|nr:pro-sigmaK processing inhibitor BofA family protein [Paenibacillus sp. 32O-W]